AQLEPALERGAHVLPRLIRFEVLRVLEHEVGVDEPTRRCEERLLLCFGREDREDLGILLDEVAACRARQRMGQLRRACGAVSGEQPLEGGMDDGAAERRVRRRLRQPVDAAESELQGALDEVVGPRGRKTGELGHITTVTTRTDTTWRPAMTRPSLL